MECSNIYKGAINYVTVEIILQNVIPELIPVMIPNVHKYTYFWHTTMTTESVMDES